MSICLIYFYHSYVTIVLYIDKKAQGLHIRTNTLKTLWKVLQQHKLSFNQSSHPVTNDLVGFFQLAQVFINITADNCQSILHTTYLNIQVSDNCELPVKLTLVIPTIALFIIPFAFIPIWILLNITLRFIFSQQFLISVIVLLLLPPTLQLFYIHVLLNVAIYHPLIHTENPDFYFHAPITLVIYILFWYNHFINRYHT